MPRETRHAPDPKNEGTMYRKLSDLRILQLAHHFEETFERYEKTLRAHIAPTHLREELEPLFGQGPGHAALNQAYKKLRWKALDALDEIDAEDALQVILECERSAREFYLHYLDRLSDPYLVEVFHRMANEEAAHAKHVERVLARLRATHQAPELRR